MRQFRDRNTSLELDRLDAEALADYVTACGRSLARGHAQSPGIAFIAAYVDAEGGSDELEDAVMRWALSYADQAESDHAAFLAAIESGRFVSGDVR